jgi:hypothetical protein
MIFGKPLQIFEVACRSVLNGVGILRSGPDKDVRVHIASGSTGPSPSQQVHPNRVTAGQRLPTAIRILRICRYDIRNQEAAVDVVQVRSLAQIKVNVGSNRATRLLAKHD